MEKLSRIEILCETLPPGSGLKSLKQIYERFAHVASMRGFPPPPLLGERDTK